MHADLVAKVPCPNPISAAFLQSAKMIFKVFRALPASGWSKAFDLPSNHSSDAQFLQRRSSCIEIRLRAVVEQVADNAVAAVHSGDTGPLASGAVCLGYMLQCCSASNMSMICERGWYGAVTTFHRTRACSQLPVQWWIDHSATMTEQTIRVCMSMGCMHVPTKSSLEDWTLIKDEWEYTVGEAIHTLRMVHDGKLSASQTMFMFPAYFAAAVVEFTANEGQTQMLAQARIPEACIYMIENDFDVAGLSLGISAAGIAVSLIGSNESGLTLNKVTIQNVVKSFANFFDETTHYFSYPLSRATMYARRVARALVADANKPFVLQAAGVLNTLVDGLLLEDSNPKKGLEGAAELQQVCAEALQELSLSMVGEAALKADGRAMAALRELRSAGLTAAARQCAAGALFKLEGKIQAGSVSGTEHATGGSGDGRKDKHVMISYQCKSASS